MKRIIYTTSRTVHDIHHVDIVVYVDATQTSRNLAVAATTYVHHPKSSRYPNIPDECLEMYDDFIGSVLGTLSQYPFTNIKHHGESNSYSYYIRFDADPPETAEISKWEFLIRLSDHPDTGINRFKVNPKLSPDSYDIQDVEYLRSIVIGPDKEFKGVTGAMVCLAKMFSGIAQGDLKLLAKDYRNEDTGNPDVFL